MTRRAVTTKEIMRLDWKWA